MPNPTVTFHELANSPTESFDEDGFRAVMRFECAWTDRIDLAKQLVGSAFLQYGTTIRTDPFEYPYGSAGQVIPGSPVPLGTPPVVHGVEVEPLQDIKASAGTVDTRFVTYVKAVVTATFRVPTWKKLPVPNTTGQGTTGSYEWVTETLQPSAEFITMPNQKLWWDAAKTVPVDDQEAPGLLVKMEEWTRTRHRVIRTHPSVFDLIGCVNKDPVASEKYNRTFEPETLLYTPPRLEPIVMPDGTKAHDLVMKFAYRPVGWNRFWRSGVTQDPPEGPSTFKIWKPVPIYDDAGKPLNLYRPADFYPLLWS